MGCCFSNPEEAPTQKQIYITGVCPYPVYTTPTTLQQGIPLPATSQNYSGYPYGFSMGSSPSYIIPPAPSAPPSLDYQRYSNSQTIFPRVSDPSNCV